MLEDQMENCFHLNQFPQDPFYDNYYYNPVLYHTNQGEWLQNDLSALLDNGFTLKSNENSPIENENNDNNLMNQNQDQNQNLKQDLYHQNSYQLDLSNQNGIQYHDTHGQYQIRNRKPKNQSFTTKAIPHRTESFTRFEEGSIKIFALKEIIQKHNLDEALQKFSPPITSPGNAWLNGSDQRQKGVGDYKFEKILGEGTFGKVRKAVNIKTGEHFAVKCLKKTSIADKDNMKRVLREILIVKLLKHPHIATLYDVIDTPTHLYMVFEYASGGELFDYIVNQQRVKEKEAKRIFKQIILALKYCHSHSVIHRDLKPENILLDANLDIKIIDFGFSNIIRPDSMLETFCGSPAYAAPEMIRGSKYFGCEVDIWSIGVILYALLAGHLPFDHESNAVLYSKILKAEYELPDFFSPESKDLISNLLKLNPKERLTIDEIWNHPWLNDSQPKSSNESLDQEMEELIRKSLEFKPFSEEYQNEITFSNYDFNNSQASSSKRVTFKSLADEEFLFHPNSESNVISPLYFNADQQEDYLNPEFNPSLSVPASPIDNYYQKSDPNFFVPNIQDPTFVNFGLENPDSNSNSNSFMTSLKGYLQKGRRHSERPSTTSKERSFFVSQRRKSLKHVDSGKQSNNNESKLSPIEPNRRKVRHSLGPDLESSLIAFQKEKGFYNDAQETSVKKQKKEPNPLKLHTDPYLPSPMEQQFILDSEHSIKLRVIKGIFNVDTTSTKHPNAVALEISKTLKENQISFSNPEGYLFDCFTMKDNEKIRWEIEICKVQTLGLTGVIFKRRRGKVWVYKSLIVNLIHQFQL